MMEVWKESYIGALLMRFWALLTVDWPQSVCGRALDAIERWVVHGAKESAICQFLWRDGLLARRWKDSLTCGLLDGLLNLPGAVCGWIYRKGKNFWDGSAVCRLVGRLGWMFALPMGLFLLVMLVVPHGHWDNRYALLGAVALTGLFVVGNCGREDRRLELHGVGPYFVLFMGFACFAFVTSISRKQSLRFVGFYLTLFLIVLLVVSAVKSYDQLKWLLALVVAGLTVASVYGCYQAVIGVEVVPSQQDMALNAGMPGRIYSFFDNPNNFAEILVMLMPFALALFLNAETWRGKLWGLFALCVSAVSLGATLSRSGWLGMAFAVVVFLFLENWKLIPLIVVLAVCALPLLPDYIYNRLLTIGNTRDSSLNYRFAIYQASGVLLKDYWFKGVGLGSNVLKTAFEAYPPMFDGNYPIHTHNNYLQVWGEMGIVGLITFLGTILYQLKQGVKAYLRTTDKRLRRFQAAAVAGFCGILLISAAEYTWFYPRNMFFYWFLFGVIMACAKLAPEEKVTP